VSECKICGFTKWRIANAYMCRRCDTVSCNGQRVGPPNAPGTKSGWFPATFGDRK